jgi:hypothetical protein
MHVAEWGEFKLDWLRRFLSFEAGAGMAHVASAWHTGAGVTLSSGHPSSRALSPSGLTGRSRKENAGGLPHVSPALATQTRDTSR